MADPLERFLTAARSVGLAPRKVGGEYRMVCPCHLDKRPSLYARLKGGKLVLICRSARCSYRELMVAVGLNETSGFSAARLSRGGPKVVAIYDYHDEAGKIIYQKVRYSTGSDPKRFIQRRPDDDGQFIYGLEARWYEHRIWGELSGWWSVSKKLVKDSFEYYEDPKVRPKANARWFDAIEGRVPYRLREIRKLSPKTLVIWTEGEKGAEALRRLGLEVSTGGGTSGWDDSWPQYFKGLSLAILPDNDPPGRRYVEGKVALGMYQMAARVRVVALPGLPPKGDVYDWIQAGGTAEELLRLVESVPDWERPVPSAPQPDESAETRSERGRVLRAMVQKAAASEGLPKQGEDNAERAFSQQMDIVNLILARAGFPYKQRAFIDALIGVAQEMTQRGREVGWFEATDYDIGRRMLGNAEEGSFKVDTVKKHSQRARKAVDDWQQRNRIIFIEAVNGGMANKKYLKTRYRLPILGVAVEAWQAFIEDLSSRRSPEMVLETVSRAALQKCEGELYKKRRGNPRREGPKAKVVAISKLINTKAAKAIEIMSGFPAAGDPIEWLIKLTVELWAANGVTNRDEIVHILKEEYIYADSSEGHEPQHIRVSSEGGQKRPPLWQTRHAQTLGSNSHAPECITRIRVPGPCKECGEIIY